jgi:predicted nucleic acid-binding protein
MSPTTVICVDASFIVRLLFTDPDDSSYQSLWDDWNEAEASIIAPSLLLFEVTNAIHRYAIAGAISEEIADQLITTATELPIELYWDASLHQQAIAIARRFSLPATYDAHYLALAEQRNAQFWTVDRRLARAVGSELSGFHYVDETNLTES